MKYIYSWSGGKDSTAAIILDHIHGLPPSKIIFSEVMFDKRRGISGELPEHMDFVKNKAIPVFLSWGYEVEILHSNKDYLDCFYHTLSRSKNPLRNGKRAGFPLSGMCVINSQCKMKPIKNYIKGIDGDFVQYIGIATDEPKRLEKLRGTNRISLLERYEYTEKMAYDLCEKYGLLSPIYRFAKRGGCWFCPNQRYTEFARLKVNHPDLWGRLKQLSKEENLVSQGFRYGKTFDEVEKKVDEIINSESEE